MKEVIVIVIVHNHTIMIRIHTHALLIYIHTHTHKHSIWVTSDDLYSKILIIIISYYVIFTSIRTIKMICYRQLYGLTFSVFYSLTRISYYLPFINHEILRNYSICIQYNAKTKSKNKFIGTDLYYAILKYYIFSI